MDIKRLIKEYTAEKQVMQVVTVKNGKPWICSVHYAFDENGHLYWMSSRSTRHSQELKANKTTAAAILISPDEKQCIHMEGESFELTDDEAKKADEIYGKRYGQKDERLKEALSTDQNVRAYYVFKPTYYVLFDHVTFPNDPRQEYRI